MVLAIPIIGQIGVPSERDEYTKRLVGKNHYENDQERDKKWTSKDQRLKWQPERITTVREHVWDTNK